MHIKQQNGRILKKTDAHKNRKDKNVMKKIIAFFCFSLLLTSCLTGCNSNTLQNNLSQIRIAKAAELEEEKSRIERANEIKQSILELEEIQQAAVVIEGKTALIGIVLKEEAKKDVIRLKEQADILAKKADKTIDATAITANENITAMIEKMEKERQSTK